MHFEYSLNVLLLRSQAMCDVVFAKKSANVGYNIR